MREPLPDDATPSAPAGYRLRRLEPGDGEPLARFYNGRSDASKRLFRPIGLATDAATCEAICRDNVVGGDKYDLVVTHATEIVGWGFIWGLKGERPSLGLGVADAHQGRGLGRALMSNLMTWARQEGLKRVELTVVKENAIARGLYEAFGFGVTGERVSSVDGLTYCDMAAEPGG